MEKNIWYGIFTGHDINRKTNKAMLGFDVLIGEEIKHLTLAVNETQTLTYGQAVLVDIVNNTYLLTANIPLEERGEFERAYEVKYEEYKRFVKENNLSLPQLSSKENSQNDILGFVNFFEKLHQNSNQSLDNTDPKFEDYYLGFTFDGRLMPFRKAGLGIDPLTGNELLKFISLRNADEVFYTDFTEAYLDKFGLWGLRPIKDYININDEINEESMITIFYQLIPDYLRDKEITKYLFKQIKDGKIAVAHQYISGATNRQTLFFVATVQRLEEIVKMYHLAEPLEVKGAEIADFWQAKH